ncbi:hypothetical protein ADL35_33015 [Streptomyces sp. NRRL WC-3753]|nr:hypothetical protein ADL35_33015 [Streptomyces sp. NRRL WC-3753]
MTVLPVGFEEGRRVRLGSVNDTDMLGPMPPYLPTRRSGPHKDATIMLSRRKPSVFFDADNPGQ